MNREKVKVLIELSSTVEEADQIVVGEGYKKVREKIAYLSGMFDFAVLGRLDADEIPRQRSEEMDYYAILSSIINSKWED